MMKIKKCLLCKKEFETNNQKRAYCSTSCNKKLWELNDRQKNKLTKKCDFCKKEFQTYTKKPQKYCNEGCRLNNWTSQKVMCGGSKVKKCIYCEKEFEDTTIDSRKLYCSSICSSRRRRTLLSEGQRKHRYETKKIWNEENKEKVNVAARRSWAKHRKKRITESVAWRSKKRKEDPYFRKTDNLRRRLIRAMRDYTKTGKVMTSREYGIDYNKIIEHLMKNRPENVSDKDLFDFRKWHIDHVFPLSKFDLNNPEEVKKAFAPENHQWLTAKENIRKGNKIIKGD